MALEMILAAAGLSAAAPAPGREVMRAPIWRGVKEVTLACEVDPDARFSGDFCSTALAEVSRDSPYPMRLADGSGGMATMALRLAAGTRDGRTVLTIAGARAVSIDEAQGALLPRSTVATPGEAVERTLARALDGALPWRRARRQASPPRQY